MFCFSLGIKLIVTLQGVIITFCLVGPLDSSLNRKFVFPPADIVLEKM